MSKTNIEGIAAYALVIIGGYVAWKVWLYLVDLFSPIQTYQQQFSHNRKYVLRRDRYHCQWPGCTAHGSGLHVHHIVWRSKGGSNDPSNLVTYCKYHHMLLHQRRFS